MRVCTYAHTHSSPRQTRRAINKLKPINILKHLSFLQRAHLNDPSFEFFRILGVATARDARPLSFHMSFVYIWARRGPV